MGLKSIYLKLNNSGELVKIRPIMGLKLIQVMWLNHKEPVKIRPIMGLKYTSGTIKYNINQLKSDL